MGALWQIGGGENNSGKEGRVVDGAIGVERKYDIDGNPSLNLARAVQACIGRADDKGVSDESAGETPSDDNVDLFDRKEVPESAMATRSRLMRQIKEFTTEPFIHSPVAHEKLKALARVMPVEVINNFHECFFMPWGEDVMETAFFSGLVEINILELRKVAKDVDAKRKDLPEWVDHLSGGNFRRSKKI